ncbi:sensor histidine kinase [Rhizobium sp. ARZ01]|uniref:sensor histidine kinase n=1 Tax=Rhizobium sp. ARZ01 TaxID=2769313 RepID=UPI001FEE42D6|nr:sensor histidine kinase [Rhizobium sp. ARZ01]
MRRPVAFYLVCLILVVVVPSFVFATLVLNRANEAQERAVESLLKTSTGAVNRVIDREVSAMLSTLTFFSTSSYLQNGDFKGLQAQAVKALAGTDAHLLVIGKDYQQRLNTRVPSGTELGRTSDEATAQKALEGDRPAVSNLFFDQVAQKWVFNVHQPVRLNSGETVLLTLTQDADYLSKVVTPDLLSPGWNAAVLDDTGTVIVSTDAAAVTGKPFFLQVVPAFRIGLGSARHQDVDYQVVTDFSALTGWKIVTWAEAAVVQAPATSSLVWLIAGGAIIATLATAAAVFIARILSRDVRMLARDAMRLGLGERVPPRRHIISELDTVSKALSGAADARKRAESEIRFLMREVAHRSKNQLTVIQAMLNQSVTTAASPTAFADAFRKRLAGLARSTDLMIANTALGVALEELARNQLKPFVPDDPARVRMSGPLVRLGSQASQTLGMALHELATNAAKHGAFSNARGIVEFSWAVEGERLNLVWRESGVNLDPERTEAPPKGFGSVVLERMIGIAMDAELERRMHADGIEWRFSIPLSKLDDEPANMPGERVG